MKLIKLFQRQLSFEHVDVGDIVETFSFVKGFASLIVVSKDSTHVLTDHMFAHAVCSPDVIKSCTQPCTIYIARKNKHTKKDSLSDCHEEDILKIWSYLTEFEQRFF